MQVVEDDLGRPRRSNVAAFNYGGKQVGLAVKPSIRYTTGRLKVVVEAQLLADGWPQIEKMRKKGALLKSASQPRLEERFEKDTAGSFVHTRPRTRRLPCRTRRPWIA